MQSINLNDFQNKECSFVDQIGNRYHYNIINTEESIKLALTYHNDSSDLCLDDIGLEVLKSKTFIDNDRFYVNLLHKELKEEFPHLYI